MFVQSCFEIKRVVWFRIDKKEEEFDSIRSWRILRMRDSSIAHFFIGRVALGPCTLLNISSDSQPKRPVGEEG